MPFDKQGREYPSAQDRKPNRKAVKRLGNRIFGWESIKNGSGEVKLSPGDHQMHKPGSNKK